MGIQDLQSFLESGCEGGAVSVDLLRIGQALWQRNNHHGAPRKNGHSRQMMPPAAVGNQVRLVIDAECCLDRLYGGYFSDWACGGQWNRTVHFLALLMHAVQKGNLELDVFFDGGTRQQRMPEWIAEQNVIRQKVNMVLKHINTKGTPPPKVWWTPPTCLRTVLRMAFRHLNTTVICSTDDHHHSVMAHCRDLQCHGLLADHADYAVFDPPRYFSANSLKLTYKGSLESKEYMLEELTRKLDLDSRQMCQLAALLGTCNLPMKELAVFYEKHGIEVSQQQTITGEGIRKLANFIAHKLDGGEDSLIEAVFPQQNDERRERLRQTLQYYYNGTLDAFNTASKVDKKVTTANEVKVVKAVKSNSKSEDVDDLDTSGFASETTEREQQSREDYKMATANAASASILSAMNNNTSSVSVELPDEDNDDVVSSSAGSGLLLSSSSASSLTLTTTTTSTSSSSASSTTTLTSMENSSSNINSSELLSTRSTTSNSTTGSSSNSSPLKNTAEVTIPTEVMRTLTERHSKGLMTPWIYQILVNGEIRLPCLMEDESHAEFPPIQLIYRPIRQKVYGILYNLHHQKYLATKASNSEVNLPQTTVKEWIWSKWNPYTEPEIVRAEYLGWAVPTIRRLWFGSNVDDRRRRLRALLTCMRSDAPLMLNTAYVPQHMLVLALVLRYIMSVPNKCILRRQELDAFLYQALSPELMNSQHLQDLTLPVVSSRGVQLAALFMCGVEHALLANDACGAPIPWLMSCPWLYFDGKLFHQTLARASVCKNLFELCENHIDRVVKVERMRKAILEGLEGGVQFAKPPLPPLAGVLRQALPPPNCLPAINLPSTRQGSVITAARRTARAGNVGGSGGSGGQLQIAGCVVGSWGANYGMQAGNGVQNGNKQLIGGRGRGLPAYHQNYQQQQQQQQNVRPGGYHMSNHGKQLALANSQHQHRTKNINNGWNYNATTNAAVQTLPTTQANTANNNKKVVNNYNNNKAKKQQQQQQTQNQNKKTKNNTQQISPTTPKIISNNNNTSNSNNSQRLMTTNNDDDELKPTTNTNTTQESEEVFKNADECKITATVAIDPPIAPIQPIPTAVIPAVINVINHCGQGDGPSTSSAATAAATATATASTAASPAVVAADK